MELRIAVSALVALALLGVPAPVAAVEPASNPLLDQILGARTAPLKRIRCISATVTIEGSAGEIGLGPEALTKDLTGALVEAIPEVKACDATIEEDPEALGKAGFVLARVWTVGTRYPIALYVRFEGGVAERAQIFVDESLGFTERADAPEVVGKTLRAMAGKFAAEVVAARK